MVPHSQRGHGAECRAEFIVKTRTRPWPAVWIGKHDPVPCAHRASTETLSAPKSSLQLVLARYGIAFVVSCRHVFGCILNDLAHA